MKRVLKIVAIIVVVLLIAVIALPFVIDVNVFRPTIESDLSTALGRQVKVGNLRLSILGGSVAADDLSIADDPAFSKDPFIRAKALGVGVELMPLIFSKQLNVTDLTIEQPQVSLLRTADGKWNFSSLGGKTDSTCYEEQRQPGLVGGQVDGKERQRFNREYQHPRQASDVSEREHYRREVFFHIELPFHTFGRVAGRRQREARRNGRADW